MFRDEGMSGKTIRWLLAVHPRLAAVVCRLGPRGAERSCEGEGGWREAISKRAGIHGGGGRAVLSACSEDTDLWRFILVSLTTGLRNGNALAIQRKRLRLKAMPVNERGPITRPVSGFRAGRCDVRRVAPFLLDYAKTHIQCGPQKPQDSSGRQAGRTAKEDEV